MRKCKLFVGVAALILTCGVARAQEVYKPDLESFSLADVADPPSDEQRPVIGDEPWEIRLKVYGWLPAVDGHGGLGDHPPKIKITQDDVLDNLDMIEYLVPLNFEARVGHWGVYSDIFAVKVEDTFHTGPSGGVRVDAEGEQMILEMGGFYRVGAWPLMEPGLGNSLCLDLIGGARYNRLEGNLGLQAGKSISVGGTQDWWDPFVGPRVIWNLNKHFSLFARGDVGGFGMEHSSHFAWQFNGGLDWNVTRNVFLEASYRALYTNYETGSGASRFTYDITTGGPILALGVKF